MQLSDFAESPNLVALFLQRADAMGDKPLLVAKREGQWVETSWREAAAQVCLLAESLRAIGLTPGERVMIVAENRPEWCIADLAIMAAGCVTVPAYTTNTARDHLHVLGNSGARAAIVSTAKLAAPLLDAAVQGGTCRDIVAMEPLHSGQAAIAVHDWHALVEGDAPAARAAVDARIAGIGRSDLACLIYTSGTGGLPRGVRQHHGMILSNIADAARIISEDFGWSADERLLSFLPLSHAYEHTAGQFLPIGLGAAIHYAEGLEKLAANIEEVGPTVMVVVPRLFEVLRARIVKQAGKQGGAAARLMDLAVGLAGRRAAGRSGLADRAIDLLLEVTLRPKIRRKFGGRLKALVSGGAPLNPEVGSFFQAIGLTLLQGYGQTEAGPVISVNRPSAGIAMDTVGPPMAGVTVRIAQDGEICVRGEQVMHGYWDDEAASAAVLQDGWLLTGDIGEIDARDRIRITDRKKDMIVNDKGDNVSPQRIESMLTLQPEIAQAMVSGDRRPHLVALLVPDHEWAAEWARARGKPVALDSLQRDTDFRAAVRAGVDRVNTGLSVIEKVRQFAFADEPFAIDNEELTSSLKIRRHKIRARYGDRLDALYRG